VSLISFFTFFLNAVSIWDAVASTFQSGYCMFTKRAPETVSCPLNFKQYWLITLINKFYTTLADNSHQQILYNIGW